MQVVVLIAALGVGQSGTGLGADRFGSPRVESSQAAPPALWGGSSPFPEAEAGAGTTRGRTNRQPLERRVDPRGERVAANPNESTSLAADQDVWWGGERLASGGLSLDSVGQERGDPVSRRDDIQEADEAREAQDFRTPHSVAERRPSQSYLEQTARSASDRDEPTTVASKERRQWALLLFFLLGSIGVNIYQWVWYMKLRLRQQSLLFRMHDRVETREPSYDRGWDDDADRDEANWAERKSA